MRGRRTGALAGGLITAALLMGGTSPALASAEVSYSTDSAAACGLSVVKWYSEGLSKYVKVKNSCSTSKTYCVDINNWPDKGPFTISGSTTKSQRYVGIAAPTGRGVYTTSKGCGPT
ncbi:hypothetical protein [Nonomuraea endophytica]|uniref:hypothetical protein n=1 Tax=Nonomuraea endophytica TaxID=714136 RepID=UPI0037C87E8E